MFITVNDRPLNAYTILYFYKREETHDDITDYNICYRLTDGRIITETFDNEAARDEKCQTVNEITVGNSKEIEADIAEIKDDIANLKEVGFHPLKVESLPTEDIKDYILYLVPSDKPEEENLCHEYLYINNAWEMVGTTSVDLSNYLSKTNNTEFTPTDDYNPATKKYVDDNSGKTTLLDLTFFSPSKVDDSQQFIIASSNAQFNTLKGIMDKVRAGETPSVMVKCKFYRPRFPYDGSTPVLTTQIIPVTMFEVVSGKARITICIPNTYSADAVLQGLNRSITTYHISDYDSFIGGYNLQYSNQSTKLRPAYLDEVLSTKFTNLPFTPTADYHPATKKYVDDTATIRAYQLAGLTEYNDTSTYNTGDYCYYQNAIYKCNGDNVTGSWDSTKWDSKTYLEYLQDAVVESALGGSY